VVDQGGSILSYIVRGLVFLISHHLTPKQISLMYSDVNLLVFSLIIGLFWTFLGGFISALIAKRSEYLNSSIIGIVCVVHAVYGLWGSNSLPFWYHIFDLISVIPMSILGGHLALKKRMSKEYE
jgi:hypothetical protein